MAPTRLKPGLLESTYQRKQHLIKCLVDLQAHGFPHEIHIGKNLCKRFRTYVKQYKDTLEAKHSSGGGLTLAGFEVGMTLPEKNEQVVPFFDWKHAIVNPPATRGFGIREDNVMALKFDKGVIHKAIANPRTPIELLSSNLMVSMSSLSDLAHLLCILHLIYPTLLCVVV